MLERSRDLWQRLHADERTFGAWVSFNDPGAAEIMAGIGFDWVLIDTEHAPFNLNSLQVVLMAFRGSATVPIVRMRTLDPILIKQFLDLGAEGILVPNVRSVEEARLCVAACKYPPRGMRGFGPRRASDYYRSTEPYVAASDEGILVLIQIEHHEAVACVDEILAVPGLDAVLLGPMDLSGTMGLLGQLDHPRVVAAIETVIAAAGRAGLAVGVPIDAPADVVAPWVARGCRFVIVGEDHSLLRRAGEAALSSFRRQFALGSEPAGFVA